MTLMETSTDNNGNYYILHCVALRCLLEESVWITKHPLRFGQV